MRRLDYIEIAMVILPYRCIPKPVHKVGTHSVSTVTSALSMPSTFAYCPPQLGGIRVL